MLTAAAADVAVPAGAAFGAALPDDVPVTFCAAPCALTSSSVEDDERTVAFAFDVLGTLVGNAAATVDVPVVTFSLMAFPLVDTYFFNSLIRTSSPSLTFGRPYRRYTLCKSGIRMVSVMCMRPVVGMHRMVRRWAERRLLSRMAMRGAAVLDRR